MGLLDGLFPSDMPPETKRYMLAQGLLGLGAGLLKAGGPSRLPTDFGSALGAGLEQGIGSANASYGLRGQMTRNKLYDEQIKQLEQERTANEDFGKLWQQPAEAPASPAPAMPTPSSAPQIGGDQLVSAVIRQESAGNPNAVSPKGATGLMQVMPATAANPGFGVKPFAPGVPLNDPAENQRFGTDYLNAMKQRFNGDIEAALVAYNAGPGVADKWMASGKNPAILPAETRGYVQSIMGKLQSGQQPGAQQAAPVRMAQAQPQTMTDATPQARNPNARMFGVTDEQWDSVGRLPMASRRAALMQLSKENRDRQFEMQKLNRVDTPEQEAQKLRIARERQTPDRALVQVPDANSPTGFKYVPRSSIAPGTPAMGPGGTAIEFGDDGRPKSIQMGPGVRGGVSSGGMTQTNVTDLNKQLIAATSTRMHLSEIAHRFKPEYQQIPTRMGMDWAALKDKGAGWLGTASPEDKARLTDFTQYRASAAQNFSGILKELSGTAVTAPEMKRAEAWIPNSGTGWFDGDSPTELKAKVDRFTEFTDKAVARLHYAQRRGLSIDKISLDDVPDLVRKRGVEIKQELMQSNPGASDDQLDAIMRNRVAAEFGLVSR